MTQHNRKADPFEHAGGEAGVLLLHGFSGTPAEVRELGKRLHARGYGVFAPALPGHAGHAQHLDAVVADDYLNAALSALETVRARHRKTFVIGFSMGGALGLHLAKTQKLEGLVTINAPIHMPAHVQHGVPLLARFAKRAPLPVNPRALFGHPGRASMPAHAVATFLEVLERVKNGLSVIACPLLVVQGTHDETIPAFNSLAIATAIGTHAQHVRVQGGPHLLTVGRWLDTIEPVIASFLAGADRGAKRDARTTAPRPKAPL